jgi:hypothetical protein
MLYELCYYLALSGSLCLSAAGLTYHFNRPLFNQTVRKVAWKGLNVYHDITTFVSAFYDETTPEEVKDIVEDVSKNTILSYSLFDGSTAITSYIPPMHDLLFYRRLISNKTYCKRINEDEDINTLDIVPVKKPFLQVELKYKDKSLDIHKYLNTFYVKDNHILDKLFLQWYVKYWFLLDLDEEYTIHIIDNEVNMFTLNSTQSILLEGDKYLIINTCDDPTENKEEEKEEEEEEKA